MDSPFTLLVVEDDPGHARLVLRSLRRAGVNNDTVLFHDGGDVLSYLRGQGPQGGREPGQRYLVLLDLRMPRMDGFEVLREINGDPSIESVPVVILTTTQNPDEVELAMQLGAKGFLVKPVQHSAFLTAVRAAGLAELLDEVDAPLSERPESSEEPRLSPDE